jgi:hypothetical protein
MVDSLCQRRNLQESPRRPECEPMTNWDENRTQQWLHSNGFAAESNKMEGAAIDGFALAHLSSGDMAELNIPIGRRGPLSILINDNTWAFDPSGMPATDSCSAYFGEESPLYLSMYLSKLIEVDEKNYAFSVQFWIHQVWFDDRHQYLPLMSSEEADDCQAHLKDPMTMFSRNKCTDKLYNFDPSSELSNGWVANSKGEWNVLKTWPLFHFGDGVFGMFKNVVMSAALVQADFTTEMAFEAFPYDAQSLKMELFYSR